MQLENQEMDTAILTALADRDMVGILNSAMHHTRSAWDIIMDTKIPPTTAYRKIKWLLREKLLVVDSISISVDGRKYSLFHSVLRSVVVKYVNNNILIEKQPNYTKPSMQLLNNSSIYEEGVFRSVVT